MSIEWSMMSLIQSDPKLQPNLQNKHEKEIINKLRSDIKMFNIYSSSALISEIKRLVPVTELTIKCQQRLKSLKSNSTEIPNDLKQLENRDVFFLLLLEWFKSDFFTWFDYGFCKPCNKPMKFAYHRPANTQEAIWGASDVEVYKCLDCDALENFPRYNHPKKLLETRKGRCGEWRNCFSAICVTFGYTIRLINDFQDHVWNEIYLESQQRWIHFDCCENAFDTPLMYEAGWNKKITYCIATSEHECQDVTLRYVLDHQAVLERRRDQCRPDWLIYILLAFTAKQQKNCTTEMKKKLLERRFAELASLIVIPGTEKKLKESEKQGRCSGSIAWRIARGEFPADQNSGYVIKFNFESNEDSHRFTYQPVADVYLIDGARTRGWSSTTFQYENIYKKTEKDWKMTYLCRQENSDCSEKGVLVYKFDASFDWSYLMVKVEAKTYETGQVAVTLSTEPETIKIRVNPNDISTFQRADFPAPIDHLLLTITLSGGSGAIGWQQAQLFRHSTESLNDDYSLDIVFGK